MSRVKGPGKGQLIIYLTDKKEYLLVPLEPIEADDTQFGNIENLTARIKLQAVEEDGHIRFEKNAIV